MTDEASQLAVMADRLAAIAERLADEGIPDDRAVALAQEAAELSSKAGKEIDSALAELSAKPDPQSGDTD